MNGLNRSSLKSPYESESLLEKAQKNFNYGATSEHKTNFFERSLEEEREAPSLQSADNYHLHPSFVSPLNPPTTTETSTSLPTQVSNDILLPSPWSPDYIKIAEELCTEKRLQASDPQLKEHYGKTELLFRKMLQIEDASATAKLDERTDESLLYEHSNWCYRQAIEECALKRNSDWEGKAELFETMAINFSKAAHCLEQIALSLKTEPPLIVDTLPQLHEALAGTHLEASLERIKEWIENSSTPINDFLFGKARISVVHRNLSNFSFQESESIKKYRGIIEEASAMTQHPDAVKKLELQISLFKQASQYLQETRDLCSRIPSHTLAPNIDITRFTSLL